MKINKIERRSLLSTLWIFILFNMIFRDLHQFASEDFIEEIMSSEFPEELVLVFGLVIEIPIMMVLLTRILNDKVNKWLNILASLITLAGLMSTLGTADMDDIFFTIVESCALAAIIVVAWKLPAHKSTYQLQ